MKIMVNGIECDDLVLRKENKKISIYELLGLIKDGKAPKKIRYGLTEWFYDDDAKDYFKGEDNVVSLQMTYVSNPKWLNLEIEPIEDEFIDIESFGVHYSWDYIDYKNIEELKKYVNKDFQRIFDTLDALIKNQKVLINKLKEEGK